MAALAPQLFFRAGQGNEDQEQLLKLFWSRASLKKQFDRLRNENFQLREQLKQEEVLKLRLQQRFEQLESMLANPATASVAITYYQLRDLWYQCNARLLAVSAELWKTHYDVEYRRHVAKFRRELYKSLSLIQRELHEVSRTGESLSAQILALRELRNRRHGFWNFFRRRALTAEINVKRTERRAITMRVGELTEEMQSCSSAGPPQFDGLLTATKRSINLAVIAHAQELYLHFADHALASLVREAALRQVADVEYGDSQACRAIRRRLERRGAMLRNDEGLEDRARVRAEYLAGIAVYNRDEDALPGVDTVACIYQLAEDGQVCGKVDVNVVADEYWDLLTATVT